MRDVTREILFQQNKHEPPASVSCCLPAASTRLRFVLGGQEREGSWCVKEAATR